MYVEVPLKNLPYIDLKVYPYTAQQGES